MSEEKEPDSEENHSNEVSDLPGVAAFATMGITIAVTVGVGVLLGIWADNAWGAAPLWLVIGLVLGTVAAVVSVKQQIRRFL
jgi:F0F1-type ATP synthase assembly protein I